MTRSVQILAFDGMEVLDYAGPYEVFNVAGDLTDPPAFTVASVGVTERPAGRGGFKVIPDFVISDVPASEILIVPGGAGTRRLMRDPEMLEWLRARAASTELLLTVCTGALLAGAAGLLDGLDATTHHGAFDELAAISGEINVIRGKRFVKSSDRIRTSGGVSAGTDLALQIVGEFAGPDVRAAVENEMEWMWPDGRSS